MRLSRAHAVGDATGIGLRPVLAPLLVMAVVYLIYAWDRVVVPVTLVEVRAAYRLSLSSSSLIASVFTLGLAITALPAGLLVARWGTRTTLVVGALLFSACTIYVPFGIGLADLLGARVAAGVGEGFYNVAMYSFLAGLTVRYRGAAAGVATTLFGLGMLSGPPAISWIQRSSADWHMSFYALGLAGIVGALALWLLIDAKWDRSGPLENAPMWPRVIGVITRRSAIVLAAAAANGVGVYAFISVYVTFLRTSWHIDQGTAAFVFSAYGLGGLLGGIPMGYIADRIGRRRFLVVSFLLAGIAGAVAFMAPPNLVVALLANFCLGMLLNGSYSNCYAAIQDEVADEDIPIATGLLATVYFLTASFSGWLLVSASGILGWGGGAMMVYTLPYWICAVLFFSTRDARRRDVGAPAA
jgi:MFS transporter, DHA1 family, inner membrane transport protein